MEGHHTQTEDEGRIGRSNRRTRSWKRDAARSNRLDSGHHRTGGGWRRGGRL